jgi:hypothetical protein
MSDPTSTVDDDTGVAPAPLKRLTDADWTEAQTLFELGKLTKTDLADKYGVSRQAISKGLSARGAVYGSKSQVVADAVIEAQKGDTVRRMEEITAFKSKQQKMVEMIQNLTVKALTDQVRATKPIGDVAKDIATLNKAMSTISTGRDELYHLFDLHRDPDGDQETEEFIVSEYSQDEIDALNRQRLGIDPDAALAEVSRSLEGPVEDVLDDLLGDT